MSAISIFQLILVDCGFVWFEGGEEFEEGLVGWVWQVGGDLVPVGDLLFVNEATAE